MYEDTANPGYFESTLDSIQVWEKLELIQAVYNLESSRTDSLFNILSIHAAQCFSFNTISVKILDTEAPHIKKMVGIDIPTGDTELDALMNEYKIDSIRTSLNYPSFPWLLLISSGTYNMIAGTLEFGKIDDIYSEIYPCSVDNNSNGDTIFVEEHEAGSAKITFSKGYGDCPAGCFFHDNWEFIIEDYTARFNRKYRD